MPCPFTGPKMFLAGPNFLYQNKNLFTYCGSHKHFVPDKKMIWIQFASTKFFEEKLNAVKVLGWLKKFGPAQNVLGPVKGQGTKIQLHWVPLQNFLWQHKNQIYWMEIIFWSGTKFWDWHKMYINFWSVPKSLGPVEGKCKCII